MIRPLIAHNYYQQSGGEDQVFWAEANLLEARGHQPIRYTRHNDSVNGQNRLKVAAQTLWNMAAYRSMRTLIRDARPQVAHFHNTLPLLSPAGYYAAKHEGVAVVQTLHNYRLFCPGSLFYRDGAVCELCLHNSVLWPSVTNACYRDSRSATAAVATMLVTHRLAGTYTTGVDLYIALTEFARDKFIEGGLPENQVVVKPNFLHTDPGPGDGLGGYALFVGRLSTEKGLETLMHAWDLLQHRVPLKIVGDGPLSGAVAGWAGRFDRVEWLGHQSHEAVAALMKEALALVFPSVWYEGLPVTIIEAFACGLPVITSRLGSMASLITHGQTGLHFTPGSPESLATQVEWALDHPLEWKRIRQAARSEFERSYTAERNYDLLIEIYSKAIEHARAQ